MRLSKKCVNWHAKRIKELFTVKGKIKESHYEEALLFALAKIDKAQPKLKILKNNEEHPLVKISYAGLKASFHVEKKYIKK